MLVYYDENELKRDKNESLQVYYWFNIWKLLVNDRVMFHAVVFISIEVLLCGESELIKL